MLYFLNKPLFIDSHYFRLLCWTNVCGKCDFQMKWGFIEYKNRYTTSSGNCEDVSCLLHIESLFTIWTRLMRSQSPLHFLRAHELQSEQLPVLELGCGLFGCFVQYHWLRLVDYFVHALRINQDINEESIRQFIALFWWNVIDKCTLQMRNQIAKLISIPLIWNHNDKTEKLLDLYFIHNILIGLYSDRYFLRVKWLT